MSGESEAPSMPNNSAEEAEVSPPFRRDRTRWLRERFIPIVSLLVAAVSLTMAYFTVKRSLETGKQLRALSDNQVETGRQLKGISDNQTTQYIGEFPGCLGRIVDVLKEAHRGEEITIISDFPGYGIYSDNRAFLSYEGVLREKVLETTITMVVLDHIQRMEVLRAQFGRRHIQAIKSSSAFRDFLRWTAYKEADFQKPEDLCVAIEQEQKKAFDSNFKSIKNKCESNRPLPILLWIVGDRVAVFSIPNLLPEQGAVEAAFITRDQRLINQLRVIALAYSCKARVSGVNEENPSHSTSVK